MKKIVVKVHMHCQKCQTKALKTVAEFGVDSVKVEGSDKDQLVVVGDGVDPVKLTARLRKKVGHAEIVSVEEVKEEKKKEEPSKDEKQAVNYQYLYPQLVTYHELAEDPKPASSCCQM